MQTSVKNELLQFHLSTWVNLTSNVKRRKFDKDFMKSDSIFKKELDSKDSKGNQSDITIKISKVVAFERRRALHLRGDVWRF